MYLQWGYVRNYNDLQPLIKAAKTILTFVVPTFYFLFLTFQMLIELTINKIRKNKVCSKCGLHKKLNHKHFLKKKNSNSFLKNFLWQTIVKCTLANFFRFLFWYTVLNLEIRRKQFFLDFSQNFETQELFEFLAFFFWKTH